MKTDGDSCMYLSKLSNEILARLGAITTIWQGHAFALAYDLARAVDDEFNRRGQPAESPIEPDTFKLDLRKYSDRDLAQALRLTGVITSNTEHIDAGELFDAIHAVLVLESATRLESTGDPRNERSYLDRNQTDAN